MKIRDRLLLAGIVIPPNTVSYHTERGCMLCVPAPEAMGQEMEAVALSRQQYEELMCAGLAGRCGFRVEDSYVAPAVPVVGSARRRSALATTRRARVGPAADRPLHTARPPCIVS